MAQAHAARQGAASGRPPLAPTLYRARPTPAFPLAGVPRGGHSRSSAAICATALQVEDLRKEIEIISQNHEREVDRKDAIIQVMAASLTRLPSFR